MVSFNNIEIALSYKSDRDLHKAYLLFKIMSYLFIVRAGKVVLQICIRLHIPITWLLKPTLFAQFCGGESLKEASGTINSLSKFNVKVILDYSVEGTETDESYTSALEETIASILFGSQNENIPFAVFKPSAFGSRALLEKYSAGETLTEREQMQWQLFNSRIELLCKTAHVHSHPIMIDAEHSFYQSTIDEIAEKMMEKYNKEKAIVYTTLQLYRTDRLQYLQKLYDLAKAQNFFLGIKFVRGAYMEKERIRANQMGYESPIYETKASTDLAYNDALKFSVLHIDRISIFNGTHNEDSSLYLTDLMNEAQLSKDDNRIWFSQLYGMSDNISFNLAKNGYNVAKYVPYGPVLHVMPYLIRRAEENTSIKGQTLRELNIFSTEIKRRRKHGN
jgi:proline dehydrogenase